MRHYLALLAAVLVALPVIAQEPAAKDAPRFDDLLQQGAETLAKTPAWSLESRRHWQVLSGDTKTEETSDYRLVVDRQGKRFRIEVQSAQAESPELTCACDGQQVTTLLAAAKIYSRGPVQTPAEVLAADQLLASSLTGSGIQAVVQSDLVRAVHAVASDIQYVGPEMVGEAKSHQFRMRWRDANAQLWLSAKDGLPLKYHSVQPAADGFMDETTSDVQFAWKLDAEVSDDSFAVALPADAQRVTNLYGSLAGDAAASLVGQKLPALDLSGVDGAEVKLNTAAARKPAVLIFWATWAAPSVRDLPQSSGFVKEYLDRGVAFFAVNVGEEPSVIANYLEGRKLQSTLVLDRQGQASASLGLTRLPASVIVGSDGIVRAVLQTEPGKLRETLAPELEKLLSEPQLNDDAPQPIPATRAVPAAAPLEQSHPSPPRRFRLRWRR